MFQAVPFHCSPIPSWRRSIWHDGNCHNTRLQLRLGREGSPWMCRSQRGDYLKGHCSYEAQAKPCSCGRWGASVCGNQRQRETHSPGAKLIMCVARATFAHYILRGNPLNTVPARVQGRWCLWGLPRWCLVMGRCSAGRGDGSGGGSLSAAAVLLAEPSDSLAPGAQQKHSPTLHSLCYLLIDSSCQWLFAFGRPSGRRRRGRLGSNGNSSAQEVDRVSFIFTKGEGKSLRRVFPGRK